MILNCRCEIHALKRKGTETAPLFWKTAPFCKNGAVFSLIIMFSGTKMGPQKALFYGRPNGSRFGATYFFFECVFSLRSMSGGL